jgi:hypothetical protein
MSKIAMYERPWDLWWCVAVSCVALTSWLMRGSTSPGSFFDWHLNVPLAVVIVIVGIRRSLIRPTFRKPDHSVEETRMGQLRAVLVGGLPALGFGALVLLFDVWDTGKFTLHSLWDLEGIWIFWGFYMLFGIARIFLSSAKGR